MADGIFEKVSTLLRANVHSVLDAALNLNKLAVFDDAVRDLRTAREELVKAEGNARGRRATLEREVQDLTREQAKRDRDVDQLIVRGDGARDDETKRELDAAVAALQITYNERTTVLSTKMQLLESVKEEVAHYVNSRIAVEARLQMLGAQRTKLETLIEARKSAEVQGKAMSRVDVYREFSADRLMQEEQVALERAQGRLDARHDAMETTVDRILRGEEVQNQLEERRTRLRGS